MIQERQTKRSTRFKKNILKTDLIKIHFHFNMTTYEKIMKINGHGRASTELPEYLKKYDLPLYILYGFTSPESMVAALQIPNNLKCK